MGNKPGAASRKCNVLSRLCPCATDFFVFAAIDTDEPPQAGDDVAPSPATIVDGTINHISDMTLNGMQNHNYP